MTTFVETHDGLQLRGRVDGPEAPRAEVLLLHGLFEHLGRHDGVTAALVAAGYRVHRSDLRGHGASDGPRAFVRRFEDHLEDLERLLAPLPPPVFLLGHSHGGLIALRYLLDHPAAVAGVIFSAPWLGATRPLGRAQVLIARAVASVAPRAGARNPLKRHPERLTRDPSMQEATRRDPQYQDRFTINLLVQAGKAQAEVRPRAAALATPFLALHGLADEIADPSVTREVVAAASAADKTHVELPGLAHELFHEPERDAVFAELVRWLDAHTGQARGFP